VYAYTLDPLQSLTILTFLFTMTKLNGWSYQALKGFYEVVVMYLRVSYLLVIFLYARSCFGVLFRSTLRITIYFQR